MISKQKSETLDLFILYLIIMSLFARLPVEVQDDLKTKKFAAIRYSSLAQVPEEGKVDDALLFDIDSPVDRDELDSKGYNSIGSGGVPTYFDFVAKKAFAEEEATDENLLELAESMLASTLKA